VRDLLMMKLGLAEKVLGGEHEKASLSARAEAFSEQDLIRYFDILLRLENEMRWTSQPRFHLEVGMMKLAKAGHVRDIEEVIRDFRQGSSTPAPALRPAATPVSAPPVETPSPGPKPAPAGKGTPEPFTFGDIFVRRLEDTSPATAVYLRKAVYIERTENRIRVLLPDRIALSQLNTTEHQSALEAVAREVIGNGASVSLIIKDQQPAAPEKTEQPLPAATDPLDSVRQEPMVRKFLDVFRGDIAQVKPARGE
jgi:DNA polymerase-3 subunit gamma/tau